MQGGLGNQLFCLAFARSVRLLTGDPVMLDLSSYGADRFGNAFALEALSARIGGLVPGRRPVLGSRWTSAVLRKLPIAVPGYAPERPDGLGGRTLAALAGRRAYFDGYWQDEAYIHDPEGFSILVRDFIHARSRPRPRSSVAIHYRTYREENHPVWSRTPERAYFIEAIEALESATGPVERIDLISDDPALAMARIGDIGREITPVTGGSAFDDLAHILQARNLILTNSSFSWWGGFCGDAAAVVYPRKRDLFHYPAPAGRVLLV